MKLYNIKVAIAYDRFSSRIITCNMFTVIQIPFKKADAILNHAFILVKAIIWKSRRKHPIAPTRAKRL